MERLVKPQKMCEKLKIFKILTLLLAVLLILYLKPKDGFLKGKNTYKSSSSLESSTYDDLKSQPTSTSKSINPGFGSLVLKLFYRTLNPKNRKSLDSLVLNGTKVLSYCIFGVDSFHKYKQDLKAVAKESVTSSLYGKEKWEVRIYTDTDIPGAFLKEIQSINPRILFVNVTGDLRKINGMTWRFLPMGDPTVDVACFRDLDSAIFKREEAAVREFLQNSRFICHVMRDHPQHYSPIMGGMWCFKNKLDPQLGKTLLIRVLEKAEKRIPNVQEARKGDDQNVLNRHVWPVVIDKTMVHDSFYCQRPPGGRPFPTKRNFKEPFVGCAKRPCQCNKKVLRCPLKCRPMLHRDWKYC